MSFPRYPAYKDSGVEWLGQVPEHWAASKLRWISRRYSGGTPNKDVPEYWQDGTVPWLNSGAVNDWLITQPSSYISEAALSNSSAKWIPAGSLLMALAGQGRTKGMTAQLAFPSTCNQSMAAIIPSAEIGARFLLWWLTANYQNIRNMAGGDLRDGLNLELLGNIPCPLPPSDDQRSMASFLDHETAKIDALIAEQQRLIELLNEKRQAVISNAVTKGLNPNAPMQPSGVEWLGDVPEHWDVVPYKRFVQLQNGADYKDIETDDGYPVIGSGGPFAFATKFMHDGESVLLGRKGTIDKPLFVTGRFWTVDTMYWTRIAPDANARFSYYAARTIPFAFYSTNTALPSMTKGAIHGHLVPRPPLTEQINIAAFLDHETAKIGALMVEAERAINLLQERRSALISAAVTGQIDVRGFASQEAA